jgi:cysteinyl-tRNA synthetase
MKYLGESIDIHGGGLENQFPHHECEIAQSEGATGKPFVRYWLHNNMVTVNGRKMGKSLGNFITLKDAFQRWRPAVVRFFVLQSHYRSTLDFSGEAVEGAARGYEKLINTVRNLRHAIRLAPPAGQPSPVDLERYRASFGEAMDDDFNSPQALAVLFAAASEVNQMLSKGSPVAAPALRELDDFFARCMGDVLGIASEAEGGAGTGEHDVVGGLMDLLVALRTDVRAQKLWPLSDKIRDGLLRMGFVLEDQREGTTWKRTS